MGLLGLSGWGMMKEWADVQKTSFASTGQGFNPGISFGSNTSIGTESTSPTSGGLGSFMNMLPMFLLLIPLLFMGRGKSFDGDSGDTIIIEDDD